MLPAVVAALQQPRLLEKALEPSNTTSSLPLMTLLLSAPVGPYICDVPGDMEAMFSHVGGGPFWGRQYGRYVGHFLSYRPPWLQEHKTPFQLVFLTAGLPSGARWIYCPLPSGAGGYRREAT